jgi:hypothetical protein
LSPDYKGIQLSPEDYQFLDFIAGEITQDGCLPFTLPITSLPKVVKQAAQFFWREADEATEERWYAINYEEIVRDSTLNAVIQLPEAIESIMNIYPIKSGFGTTFGTLMKFFREPMFYATSIGTMGSVNNLRSYSFRASERDVAWEESVARMYEFNQYKTLFQKGIRFDFNPINHKINFMGRVDGSLALSVLQRVRLAEMYNYDKFQKYVTACALERMKTIVNQFDFQYPGEIKINWDDVEARGKTMKEAIETEIKEDSSGADLIIVN